MNEVRYWAKGRNLVYLKFPEYYDDDPLEVDES